MPVARRGRSGGAAKTEMAPPPPPTTTTSAPTTTRGAADAMPSNALVDKRSDFLGQCQRLHWQFNEVRRAHYSTMMLLALLGGPA